MADAVRQISRRYSAALERYLMREQEATLQQAYELARHAMAQGLGVLEMARIHQQAMASSLRPQAERDDNRRVQKAAETFFLETLSPFEATHRGFREANNQLRQLIETLEDRNTRLAQVNVELTDEITERRRLEEMWRRYEAIVNTSKDFLTLISAQYRYEAANDAYCRAHRKKREEIVERSVSDIWGKGTFSRVIKQYLKRCFTGEEVHYQTWFEIPTLGRKFFDVSYYPYSRAGRVTHAIVVTRDITASKQAEQALRESEEHYRDLFNQACVMQENLRHLSNQILHVQEQERTRISRELHDEVGQALTAINVNLAMLKRRGASSPTALGEKITDTQKLLEQTMETVHRFSRELRPAMLDDLGLLPALRTYIKSFAERTGVHIQFRSGPEAEKLDSERKTVVYRVAQESLTNVAKHAQATKVTVSIRKLSGRIRVEIKDNGHAFDIGALNGNKRLGLLGMQERVRLVGGRFDIAPEPGKGTTVRVEIPFRI